MKRTSLFCIGISAVRPANIPSTSTGMTSNVRSGFILCITARAVNASSFNPSAFSIRVRTLFILPPTWYIPGRNTAPLISTIFEYLCRIESTLTESASANWNELMSNSSTLYTEYSFPALRTNLTDFLYASPVKPPEYFNNVATLSFFFIS